MHLLKCPSCGAGLDIPDEHQPVMSCSYCGSSMLLPDAGEAAAGSDAGIMQQAEAIQKIFDTVQAGRKIEAIKIYRRVFGGGVAEAKDAVEKLAAGLPVALNSVQVHKSIHIDTEGAGKAVRSVVVTVIILVVLFSVIGLLIFGFALWPVFQKARQTRTPDVRTAPATPQTPQPPEFARKMWSLSGTESGPGQFEDARSIALDPQGRIYLTEYTGGKIVVLSPEKTFLTQWPAVPKTYVQGLAVNRAGILHILRSSSIMRYDAATAKELDDVPFPQYSIPSGFTIAPNQDIVAVLMRKDLMRVSPDGEVKLHIKDAIGDLDDTFASIDEAAVDSNDKIYVTSSANKAVYKFNEAGKFVNRFDFNFESVETILVDHKRRVYIADRNNIRVFDEKGALIDSIQFKPGELPFGLAVNDQNELFVTTRSAVHKFAAIP